MVVQDASAIVRDQPVISWKVPRVSRNPSLFLHDEAVDGWDETMGVHEVAVFQQHLPLLRPDYPMIGQDEVVFIPGKPAVAAEPVQDESVFAQFELDRPVFIPYELGAARHEPIFVGDKSVFAVDNYVPAQKKHVSAEDKPVTARNKRTSGQDKRAFARRKHAVQEDAAVSSENKTFHFADKIIYVKYVACAINHPGDKKANFAILNEEQHPNVGTNPSFGRIPKSDLEQGISKAG